MAPAYQAVIAREFGRFVGRGLVYKGLKPVHWCMHCKTALAQAEVEYEEQRTPSVYVKFPLVTAPAGRRARRAPRPSLAIWTTTPWTLPANLAIAVHPDAGATSRSSVGGEVLIVVASARLEAFSGCSASAAWAATPRSATLRGSALVGTRVPPPVDRPRRARSPAAEFVAMDTGTGLVHIAPGHGEEDYDLGRALGLRIYNPVDDDGRFIAEVEHFAGLTVWEANPKIIELLTRARRAGRRGAARRTRIRTAGGARTPRCSGRPSSGSSPSTRMACASARSTRSATTCSGSRAWGEERIYNMIAHRPDWTHLAPARVGRADRRVLLRGLRDAAARASGRRARGAHLRRGRAAPTSGTRAQRGASCCPPGTRCAKCGERRRSARRPTSSTSGSTPGCSHAAVLETRPELRWPAELYLEGSDQHRGWFHSSLLEAVGTREAPPYKAVLTYGFVVDGEGRKMSKSARQRASSPRSSCPSTAPRSCGCGSPPRTTPRTSACPAEILDRLADAYRRIRNTYRFLLGNLARLRRRARDRQPYERLDEVDRFILDRLARLIDRVARAYEEYQFHTVFHAVHNFCAVDLSALYLDIIKDRLYTSAPDDPRRRAAQTACYDVFAALARLMAPHPDVHRRGSVALPARAPARERAPRAIPRGAAASGSTTTSSGEWDRLLEVRREVAKALELARGAQADRQRPRGGRADHQRARGPARPCWRPSGRCCRRCSSSPGSSWARARRGPCTTRARRSPAWSSTSTARPATSASAAGRGAPSVWARRRASDAVRSLRGRRAARDSSCCILAGAVVVLDQITKVVALDRLPLGVPCHRDRRPGSRSRSS